MSIPLPSSSDDAPHCIVLFVQAEIHAINKHGECAGDPIKKVPQTIYKIEAADKNVAIRKLNELLEELKSK